MTNATTPAPKPRFIDAATTATLIRPALRDAFPGIKFSVRSSNYSLGSSVDVQWLDGPTEAQVDAILARFRGDFDLDGETVTVPGSRFLTGSRTLSADFRALLIDDLSVALGVVVDESMHGSLRADVDPRTGVISAALPRTDVNILVHRLSMTTSVTGEREIRRIGVAA